MPAVIADKGDHGVLLHAQRFELPEDLPGEVVDPAHRQVVALPPAPSDPSDERDETLRGAAVPKMLVRSHL